MKRVLKRSIPLWTLIVAVSCVGLLVFSVVQFMNQINNMMTIRADYSIEVWNEDHTARVELIDWGEFANLHEAKNTTLWVKNVGNTGLRYSWNVTDFPSQFSISNEYYESGPNQWFELSQNEACPTVIIAPYPQAGYELEISFTLNCTEFKAGSYGFTLNIMSNES